MHFGLTKHNLVIIFLTFCISTVFGQMQLPEQSDSLLSISAVGDVMMGTSFPPDSSVFPPDTIRFLPPDSGKYLFAQVKHELRKTDLTFCNLEGPLLDGGTPRKECKDPDRCYVFRTPAGYIKNIVDAGFNLAGLANNHARDFKEGMASTKALLDSFGIGHSGELFDIAQKEVKGLKVEMISFAPYDGLYDLLNIDLAGRIIKRMASRSDIVIVSFHGGAEGSRYTHVPDSMEVFYGEERGHLREFAHCVIEAGADIVIGHGPHVPRAIEIYKKRLVAYSMGNFCTYEKFNLSGANGLTFILQAWLNKNGEFVKGKIIPCRQIDPGFPVIDPGKKIFRLLNNLAKEDFPETGIKINWDGEIIPQVGMKLTEECQGN